MYNRTIEDIERDMRVIEFKIKRCQYNDHLFDMENWEYELEILKEELQTIKLNESKTN